MKYTCTIRLADTDAAGRIYFASALCMAHESFEHFMGIVGFDLARMIDSLPYVLPVVRVEANYAKPLMLGEDIVVETNVQAIGSKSVTFRHRIMKSDGTQGIEVLITHASVSKKTGRAITLPPALRKALTIR